MGGGGPNEAPINLPAMDDQVRHIIIY
jgi:hypothetical protein